tara:strand:- start:2052 stop:2345 length:294 start_codon:yes stop_codon:yes gene_type:complete
MTNTPKPTCTACAEKDRRIAEQEKRLEVLEELEGAFKSHLLDGAPMAIYGWLIEVESLEDLFDLIEKSGNPFVLQQNEAGPCMTVMPTPEEFYVDGA